MMSNSVPPATMSIIATMYVCMIVGGMNAESSANGLLINISRHPPMSPSSRLHEADWYRSKLRPGNDQTERAIGCSDGIPYAVGMVVSSRLLTALFVVVFAQRGLVATAGKPPALRDALLLLPVSASPSL